MIFGDTSDFAIEAMVEPDLKVPSAVWGRMRIWCQGHQIGNYDEKHCGLYDAYKSFERLQKIIHTLSWDGIEKMTEIEIWNFLDGRLYGYHGEVEIEDNRTLQKCQADSREYGKFNFLTNWGEQFDRGGKSFIFCTDRQKITILHGLLRSEHGFGLHTTAKALTKAIALFLTWFDEEAQRLSGVTN